MLWWEMSCVQGPLSTPRQWGWVEACLPPFKAPGLPTWSSGVICSPLQWLQPGGGVLYAGKHPTDALSTQARPSWRHLDHTAVVQA